MGAIQQPDPFIDQYIYEKATDPSAKIVWKQYQKKLVDRTDHIIQMAHGNRDVVKSSDDWAIVEELVNFWADEFPQEYQDFKSQIPDIRASRNAGGYSSTREIKYLGALPQRFIKMIQIIFPYQQFNKEFMYKLIRKFPGFKIGGVNNLSKGRVII
ncbi:hypothetical protein M0R04_15555 [Candidatus Dojkabacteria bacterium]|jgi:hypothetical protein|nr:hypothetical protein [Candidatus Dojkabacteria bacterium]